MRTRSALGLSAAMIIVAACAHPVAEAPAPMAWSFNHTHSEGLKLVYGQPQSDNVLVMLSCHPQSGEVEVAVITSDGVSGSGDSGAVGLSSRQERLDLTSAVAPTPIAGLGVVIESAAANTPALDRFARTGELSVQTAGKTVAAPARGADQALVSDFFGQCGQPV
ncbi:hypothetical protein [Phenylobacterium sp.]|uniref:hypothetical protein n=1 Tax=Phenylobacterium sp. TaxID=1871053 RepID=UPI002731AABD|nr:hypothetical protein [Phenylobacterium sp.]MDP1875343.1 hypothetical protein [Phenylobacterium sp.]MDP3298497.1 hypothetical protein [Phenylobacterium sp.]